MTFEDSYYPKVKTLKGKKIEFDYSKVIILSGMLSRCYKNTDIDVKFENSIGFVADYVNDYISDEKSDDILLYMDLPVDNIDASSRVIGIVRNLINNDIKRITPILIPCIEYYAMLRFGDKSSEDYAIVQSRGLYKDSNTYKNNMSTKTASFEKYCKAAFSKIKNNNLQGAIEIERFDTFVSYDDCCNLVQGLPIFYPFYDDSIKIESKTFNKVSLELIDEAIEQSRRYECYGVGKALVDDLLDIKDGLSMMWNK